jgi:hypothetical protein
VQSRGVLPRVTTEESSGTAIGPQQAQQDADGGRLAGAVGALLNTPNTR